MPLYYFHLQDGSSRLPDRQGVPLPDSEAAWYQGIRSAREIIDRDLQAGRVTGDGLVDIVNEAGEQVCTVQLQEVIALA